MSEKLKGLINKIKEEGVKQAEEKAKTIEEAAKKKAEKILNDAKKEASSIIENAKKESGRTKEVTELALKQGSRDLILSLKAEIKNIFDKVVTGDISKAMSAENMSDILKDLIEQYVASNGKSSDIKVLLKKEDLEKLKKSSLVKMKEHIKGGIEFKPSSNINAGFSISFDKGKSFFDFTEEGLKEALCAYLNPEVEKLLK